MRYLGLRATAVLLVLGASPALRAQEPRLDADLQLLHRRLHDKASALLGRFGDSFYALGAYLLPEGEYEEVVPYAWPHATAPPGR